MLHPSHARNTRRNNDYAWNVCINLESERAVTKREIDLNMIRKSFEFFRYIPFEKSKLHADIENNY